MSDAIIHVENVSKKYQIGSANTALYLRESLAGLLKLRKNQTRDFWALRDINFAINQGDTLGVIGKNGAGKSTLLKILSQITPPTTGKITMHGRVASLLEVGTGFNLELSGRENIFLNGAILGMSRGEIKAKLDEIVAFAEIDKFLDTPVKRYSSGMYVRLAFAVAAHLEPEILIVDEVLAVGDQQFQKKCLGKMAEVGKSGRTILFVSHNMGAIEQLCNKAMMLVGGKVSQFGNTSTIVQEYLAQGASSDAITDYEIDANKEGQISRITILNNQNKPSAQIPISEPFRIRVEYEVFKPLTRALLIFLFYSSGDLLFLSAESDKNMELRDYEPGKYITELAIPAFLLNVGYHHFEVALHRPYEVEFDRKYNINFEITEIGDPKSMIFRGNKFGKIAPILDYDTKRIPA